MHIGHLVTALPSWALFGVIVVVCVIFSEIGAVIGIKRKTIKPNEPDNVIGAAVGAMLGLLAFMLGFTFSLTEARFGERKHLVIEQANAIGTCYLRAGLIPETQKVAMRRYLKDYLEGLLKLNQQHDTTSIARLEDIHLQMWQQATSLVNQDMDTQIRALFISSLNAVLDLAEEREIVALVFRIPDIFWVSLFLLSVFSMFSFGYQTGMSGMRRIVATPLLAGAFALVFMMIADMDSIDNRRFKISQKPLIDTLKMMKKNVP